MRQLATRFKQEQLLWGGSCLFLICLAIFALTNQYLVLAVPFAAAIAVALCLNLRVFYGFFLLTIPLSATVYFLNGSLSTTVPDEPLAWVILGVTAMILVVKPKALPEWFLRNSITLVITLQIAWMLVAVVFSTDVFLSLKFALAHIWFINAYCLFPVLVFKNIKDFKKAFIIMVIPITLHAIFAFLWHYTLEFGYVESNKVVAPFYLNHVDYSTILSMFFPLIYVAWRLSKGKPKLRWIIGLTLLFYVPAIVAASARAAILAIGFAFFIEFMIKRKWVNIVMPTAYVIILAAVFLLANNNYYLKYNLNKAHNATQDNFMDAVTGIFTGKDMSTSERFYRWIASVRMSKDNPIVGVGPNNFYENYKPYTLPMFATWVSRNPERSTTHNYFLLMLVEQGWPAMLLYGWLVLLVLRKAQQVYHRTNNKQYQWLVLACVMCFAAGFVNNFFSELIETHKVGATFYLAITGIIILDHLTKKEAEEKTLANSNQRPKLELPE